MDYLALYRRYRPTTFQNLIGQDNIVKTLVNQIESGRLGHAYLFTGTRGTGKTTVAKIFAKAINCLHPVNGSPCGECEVCKALQDSSNIDVIEIDAASNNGVDQIRELRENVQYPPVSCKYKVYIIDEVHMLTGAAFNALLKTLEEPPKHAVFILATTEVHKIPATILSRCMRFDFRLVPTEQIAKLISNIYDEQNKKYDEEAVYAIARAGEGSVRDALSIADTALSYTDQKLTYDDVMCILGASNRESVIKFISAVLEGDTGKILSIIDGLFKVGKSIGVLVKDVTTLLRDMLIVKTCQNANSILQLPTDKFDRVLEVAKKGTEAQLLRIMEIFSDCGNNLKYTNNPRVVFETASIKSARPETDYNIDALLLRISKLEEALKNGSVSVSEKKESDKVELKPKEIKKTISEMNNKEILGNILAYLRHNNAEMLFNVMQSVEIETVGNSVRVITQTVGDKEIIEKPSNVALITQSLSDFGEVSIEIISSKRQENIDKIDLESEKIKKIFGDDIVIIKD